MPVSPFLYSLGQGCSDLLSQWPFNLDSDLIFLTFIFVPLMASSVNSLYHRHFIYSVTCGHHLTESLLHCLSVLLLLTHTSLFQQGSPVFRKLVCSCFSILFILCKNIHCFLFTMQPWHWPVYSQWKLQRKLGFHKLFLFLDRSHKLPVHFWGAVSAPYFHKWCIGMHSISRLNLFCLNEKQVVLKWGLFCFLKLTFESH